MANFALAHSNCAERRCTYWESASSERRSRPQRAARAVRLRSSPACSPARLDTTCRMASK
eukprot:437686-Alexandrium_andersonii.AAC.1